MKRKFYHGTSERNAVEILLNGFDVNAKKLWNCSLNEVYTWDPVKIAEGEGVEEEEARECAKSEAFRSAQLAFAVCEQSSRCVVFELELDDEMAGEDISCQNMDYVSVFDNVSNQDISAIFVSEEISSLKGFFLATLISKELFNASILSTLQKKVALAFSCSNFSFEISDLELAEISRNEFLKKSLVNC